MLIVIAQSGKVCLHEISQARTPGRHLGLSLRIGSSVRAAAAAAAAAAGQPPRRRSQQQLRRPQTPPQPARALPPQPPRNPFETVPATPHQRRPSSRPPAQPQLEAPKPAPTARAARTARSSKPSNSAARAAFPQDTLKALIFTKPGDIYNEETLRRDFMILWNTGRFDDIRLETEPGTHGRDRALRRSPSAASSAPSITRASTPSPFPKFWTASKSAKSASAVESQYDPEQDSARRHRPQGIPRRARPPVRHRRSADRADSALLAEGHVQCERRARRSKSATSISPATTAKNDRWVIRGDEEPAPVSASRTPSSSRTSSPRPTTRPSSKKTRSASAQAYQDAGYFSAKTLEETVRSSSIAAARAGACR